MPRFWNIALLSATLMAPIAMAPTALRAQDHREEARTYHDKQHNDDHAWNGQEDKAYRIYVGLSPGLRQTNKRLCTGRW